MKNIFIVLSPPRVGSSCVTRALQTLGVDLETDLMAPAVHNPKGFFEDNALSSINAQLKAHQIQFPNGENSLDPFKSEMFALACSVLKSRFKSCDNYGFKDPKTVTFLPFWQKVFKALNLNDAYVIATRNPLCCTQSMTALTFEKSQIVWFAHLLPTYELTKNKKRIVVDYDEMMQSPRKQLERMANALGLSYSKNEMEWQIYCDEFLDKSLHHHKYTYEQFKSNNNIFPLCAILYSCLLKLARDEIDFQNEDLQLELKDIEEHLKKNRFVYRYLNILQANNEKYEAQLKKTRELNALYKKSEEELKKAQELNAHYKNLYHGVSHAMLY